MAVLLPNPIIQFFDNNGDPLSGGKLYTYEAGTTTPKATYTDSSGTTPLSNPVILDAYGRASIWVDGSYKYSLYTSADVLVKTEDNVSSFNTSASTIDALVPSQSGNAGKSLITNGANVLWGYSGPPLAAYTNKVIYGMVATNNATDATNDIDVSSGYAVSDDGAETIYLSSTITKRIDASWAVGTGNGGLDTGSASDATYYIWVIKRTDTDVVDALISLSSTAPTMPSGYTKKTLVGSFVRRSSANLAGVANFYSNRPYDMANSTTSGTTSLFTGFPSGIRRVKVSLFDVSQTGATARYGMTIGSGGSLSTSGYASVASFTNSAGASDADTSTTDYILINSVSASPIINGVFNLTLQEDATNTWVLDATFGTFGSQAQYFASGRISLAGAIDRLSINLGSGTFSNGRIRVEAFYT